MRDQHQSLWQRIRSFFRGYRKEYFDYLYYQYHFFTMKGITSQGAYSLEQPEVYVDVNLAPADLDQLLPSIVSVSKKKYENSHRIWEYLGNEPDRGNKLIVVGSPGSGKTTLLKQVVLVLCRLRKAYNLPPKIPILLLLRNHVGDITRNPRVSLTEVLRESMLKADIQFKDEWFQRKLKRGQCVVLLDGLDEIGDNYYREKVIAWIESQFAIYPRNHFIITSRPHGVANILIKDVDILQILPLENDHIEKFIQDWYWAIERRLSQSDDPGIRRLAREGAEDLWRRIQNTDALHPLAQNALLLTMIATLHRFDATLPGRRVELYDAIFRIFFRRREALGFGLLTAEQNKRVLLPLAKYMMENQRREISLDEAVLLIQKDLAEIGGEQIHPVEFLRGIQEQSGLLLEVAENEYAFASLTFQEYLASVYYAEKQQVDSLVKEIKSQWWWETIRLYCAQTDGGPIIQSCLEEEPIQLDQLQLAISCLEEALRVEIDVRRRLNAIINRSVDHPDPKWRNVIAAALLYKRLRFMDRIDNRLLIDSNLVSNVEYQIFLDQEAEKGHYYYPDHWIECNFPSGKALEPVVGVRSSDVEKFCEWLVPHDIWRFRYRLPDEREITVHKCESAGFQYWLSDGKTIRVSEAKRHISPRYKEFIIEQSVNDVETFKGISSAARREKTVRPMSDLLGEILPIEGRGTYSGSGLATDVRAAEIQKGEMIKVKEWHLLQAFRKFAVNLDINLDEFLDCINVVSITNKSHVQAFDWMPVFPYPPEYGFDLGREIVDFSNHYTEAELRTMLGRKFDIVIHAYKLASTIILERSWPKLVQPGEDRAEIYDLARSAARISLLSMAFAGKTSYLSFSRDVANIYLLYCLLERRITGKEIPVEGIRLVKFS
jgi:hypothetical protein